MKLSMTKSPSECHSEEIRSDEDDGIDTYDFPLSLLISTTHEGLNNRKSSLSFFSVVQHDNVTRVHSQQEFSRKS